VNTTTHEPRPSKLANTVAKFTLLLAYFDDRISSHEIGLDSFSVEGCEFALALIDRATDLDWERIGRDAKLKDRPRTTIGLLRAEFQRRLNAAKAEESIR
jgi:hypothetical protein